MYHAYGCATRKKSEKEVEIEPKIHDWAQYQWEKRVNDAYFAQYKDKQ